jgi:hypothetical protein
VTVAAPPVASSPSSAPQGSAASVPRSLRPPRTNARSAAADPAVVGANPGLFHFDVEPSAVPATLTQAQWTSLPGLERLILDAAPAVTGNPTQASHIELQVSRDKANLDQFSGPGRAVQVRSRPGTVVSEGAGASQGSQLLWEPLTGVWAIARVPGDEAAAVRFAETVTFDHVLRCAVPFRLTTVPEGTVLEACTFVADETGVTGRATVGKGDASVTVSVGPRTAQAPTTTINGRPATVREQPGDGGANILQIDIDYSDRVVDLLAEGRYDKATVIRIAEGYQAVSGADPNNWPASPLN